MVHSTSPEGDRTSGAPGLKKRSRRANPWRFLSVRAPVFPVVGFGDGLRDLTLVREIHDVRDLMFRRAALVLGILGIPSLAWQVRNVWPLDPLELYFYGLQALMLWVFLSYGSGLGYRPYAAKPQETSDTLPETSENVR